MKGLDDGAVLFTVRCGGCHDDTRHCIGPTLKGFLDREIDSAPGYNYSPALQQLKGHWTNEQLDAFIADPRSVAPGTTTAFGGIEEPEARRKIIDYMRRLKNSRPCMTGICEGVQANSTSSSIIAGHFEDPLLIWRSCYEPTHSIAFPRATHDF
jgi:cytochrome c